jgi:dihydroorotase
MSDWLIRNARVVDSGRRYDADVRIRAGRIDAIAPALAGSPGEREFDAAGRLLLPGLIDDQVHFREPGFEHKGDLATESRAAVAGGITSVMEMPNTKPQTVTIEALEDKYARAAQRSLANHAFYLGATNDNLEQIRRLQPGQACGVKVFMGASTGNMLVDNEATLDAIFRDAPTIVTTHCEHQPTIEANLAAERARGPLTVDRHPYIRDVACCVRSSRIATGLARRHDARLHVLHVSTAEEIDLFDTGPVGKRRVTAETCVHFLHFDARDYATKGNFIKCNPAIKFERDREALIEGLADGRLTILATDHAPHTLAEKEQPYEQAPAGLPLVQHALQCVLERVHDGRMTVETVVDRYCHAPAIVFGVRERGYVREGFHADLVLVDFERPQAIRREDVLSKCGWSPFEGCTFRSSVAATWVNGHLAWRDGRLDDSVPGQRLALVRGRD